MPIEDASREKVYAAEKGIAGIRVAIIALNSLVYHFLLPKEGTIPALAYAIIVLANAYGLFVYLGKPYVRFPAMMSSYFTTLLDASFITLWLAATGGVASPFHLLWLVSVTAVAFRYGLRETITAAGVYAASYLGLAAALGQVAGHATDLLLRVAYIFFTAAIGGLLARETSEQTRAKVELRDLAAALRESEERFRRLSDATFEGIAIHEHGRILECNRTFAAMFGYEPQEVIGRSAFDFVAPESHALIAERLRVPSEASHEALGLHRDGTRLEVEMVGRDFPYGGRRARVVAVRDVGERKRAEREAREREALQQVNERLRELDRLKTQFINNAAHELGTPLTPVKIQAHLLRSGSLGPINERQERALAILQRNVDQLNLLVRDVLDASRVQTGKLAIEPRDVALDALLRDVAESFHDAAAEQGVALRLDVAEGVRVRADPARLTQVLFNLLHNALKVTPQGGRIEMSSRAEEGARAVVEVRDTGTGIDPKDLPRLFQPFTQVHDKMQVTRGGTGLGLYVSRGIVEQHGGDMWCRSEGRGRGTTFGFSVPLPPGAGDEPASGVELPPEEVE